MSSARSKQSREQLVTAPEIRVVWHQRGDDLAFRALARTILENVSQELDGAMGEQQRDPVPAIDPSEGDQGLGTP